MGEEKQKLGKGSRWIGYNDMYDKDVIMKYLYTQNISKRKVICSIILFLLFKQCLDLNNCVNKVPKIYHIVTYLSPKVTL